MSIAESLAFASSARVAQNLYIYISGHFDYGGRRRADATSASVAQSWRRRRGARHTGTRITCFTGTQVQILTPYVRAPQLVGTDIKLPSKPTQFTCFTGSGTKVQTLTLCARPTAGWDRYQAVGTQVTCFTGPGTQAQTLTPPTCAPHSWLGPISSCPQTPQMQAGSCKRARATGSYGGV